MPEGKVAEFSAGKFSHPKQVGFDFSKDARRKSTGKELAENAVVEILVAEGRWVLEEIRRHVRDSSPNCSDGAIKSMPRVGFSVARCSDRLILPHSGFLRYEERLDWSLRTWCQSFSGIRSCMSRMTLARGFSVSEPKRRARPLLT